MVYSQCSADIAWPCPCLPQCCWLLFFHNITLLQNQYFSALLWMFSPALPLDVLSGHFSLLNIESGLFALLSASALCSFLCLDVPADLKPQFKVFCLFYRRWKRPWFIWRRDFWNLILCVHWTCTITFHPSIVVWKCLGKRVCLIFFISWGLMILHTVCTVSVSGQCWHDSVVRKHQAAKLSGWGEAWLQWCLKITHLIKISQFRGFKNLLQNSCCLLFPFVFFLGLPL